MNTGGILNERINRIKKSVALEKPDRVPVVLEYGAFAARVTDTPMSEYLLDYQKSVDVMIEAYKLIGQKGEADAIHYGSFYPYGLSMLWLSKVSVPGVDLPEDVSYQVVEKEFMTREDYDVLLKKGWPTFQADLLTEKIFNDVPKKNLPQNLPYVDVKKEWEKINVPVLLGGTISSPFESLCGARSLPQFFMDLAMIPDKVQEVMDHIVPYLAEPACQAAKNSGMPAVWVGGWRGAPAMISPQMWERFVWIYFKKLVNEVLNQGLIPILHLDSCWDRELERFLELPKGKIVMALDGETDIFKAKKILGNHMCLMGDVPAVMLFNGTPDEVYEYSSKLIREIGKDGFILQSGCDIPENAKLENVQAMVQAALDS